MNGDRMDEVFRGFDRMLESMGLDEVRRRSDEDHKQNERDFKDFKIALESGMCVYCQRSLTHFAPANPCFHWLLKPPGFRSKYFSRLYAQKNYHRIEAYLRWVATVDAPLRNINDLNDERSPSKFIETTIRYKNLEWSFSCSHSDFVGHAGKSEGAVPHYHFQMKENGNVIIKYAAHHIPFDDEDFFGFAVKAGKSKYLAHRNIQGPSIQSFLDHISPDELIEGMVRTDNESEATFNMQTIVESVDGSGISGEAVHALYEESKKTGVPMARLVNKLPNARAKTMIFPGPALPDIAKRTPRKR